MRKRNVGAKYSSCIGMIVVKIMFIFHKKCLVLTLVRVELKYEIKQKNWLTLLWDVNCLILKYIFVENIEIFCIIWLAPSNKTDRQLYMFSISEVTQLCHDCSHPANVSVGWCSETIQIINCSFQRKLEELQTRSESDGRTGRISDN